MQTSPLKKLELYLHIRTQGVALKLGFLLLGWLVGDVVAIADNDATRNRQGGAMSHHIMEKKIWQVRI
jgi:hypothetical protein